MFRMVVCSFGGNEVCFSSLPLPVKHRVRALKNLQVKVVELEAKFYEEVQQLEAKYQAMYQPLLDKVSNNYWLITLYMSFHLYACTIHLYMN